MKLLNQAYDTLRSNLDRASYDRLYRQQLEPEIIEVRRTSTAPQSHYRSTASPMHRSYHAAATTRTKTNFWANVGWSTVAMLCLLILMLFFVNKVPLIHLNDNVTSAEKSATTSPADNTPAASVSSDDQTAPNVATTPADNSTSSVSSTPDTSTTPASDTSSNNSAGNTSTATSKPTTSSPASGTTSDSTGTIPTSRSCNNGEFGTNHTYLHRSDIYCLDKTSNN